MISTFFSCFSLKHLYPTGRKKVNALIRFCSEVITLGRRLRAHAVLFIPAGTSQAWDEGDTLSEVLVESDVLSGNSLADSQQIPSSLGCPPEIMSARISATDLIVTDLESLQAVHGFMVMVLTPDTSSH